MLLSNGTLTPTTSSLGDNAPAYGEQYLYNNLGVALSDTFSTYGAVYQAQVWIASLVNKIAFGTARLPLKVYERADGDARSEVRDSPYAELLRKPNPRHDRFFFWLWTMSTFEVYGEALWVKVRPSAGAPPSQLWPLHPANVITRRDENGNLIYRYVFATSGSRQFLEWGVDDVVHFKSYNPSNQVRGLSRLEPLRQTILNEDAARRASGAMWRNGGRPSMALTAPNALSQQAIDRLKAQVNALHAGVDNWGKIAILEEGLKPELFTLNADEMQYIQSRQMSREEACGVYDVPPPVVHILDHATFSNITEQMRSMYRDTMAPRLGLLESVLEAQLRPDFDARGNVYAEFLLDEVMRGAFEQRAAAGQAAVFSGQRTPNELRKQDNLPPLDGGDRLYINAGAIPLEAATAAPTDGDPQPAAKGVAGPMPSIGCAWCAASESNLSARGLCRSCEGRSARLLAARKEQI